MAPDLLSNYYYAEKVITHSNYDYIYVSPHLDDVTLSCSGTIYSHRTQGLHILVVTLFAGDPQPPFSALAGAFHQLWKAQEQAPYLERKEEERNVMAVLDVDYLWLDWLEVIYRDPALSDLSAINNRAANPHDDPIFPTLRSWLTDLCSTYPRAQIVAPLSIGDHRDHILAFQASLDVLDHSRLLFFEDFPYIAYLPEEATELAKLYNLTSIEVDISDYLDQRFRATEAYQSQLDMLFFPPDTFRDVIREYTSTLGKPGRFVERYWRFLR